MNIHIVKGLLTECAHLVEPFFTAGSFSPEESRELIRMYDRSEPEPLPVTDGLRTEEPTGVPPLSFGCNFSREQMAGIVSCANTYHLFSVSVRSEDMEALFTCKEGFRIRVNNNRHVAVLFDALLENTLIQPYWQSVLDKGHFLLSKDGKRYVTASSLSTALSAARIHMTSISYGIRKAIKKLKE